MPVDWTITGLLVAQLRCSVCCKSLSLARDTPMAIIGFSYFLRRGHGLLMVVTVVRKMGRVLLLSVPVPLFIAQVCILLLCLCL